MLGYDVYEDKRSFEKEGLTGNVKKYTTEKMSFPCFVIVSDEEHKVPLFKIKTIKQMSSTVDIYNEEDDDVFMLKVTNLDSGRTIDMVTQVVADAEIAVNLLSPNTKYLFKGKGNL